MTSNYLTASRARHVTFPRYWAMGRSILSLHYTLLLVYTLACIRCHFFFSALYVHLLLILMSIFICQGESW